jgi:cell division protein FtsB
MPFLLTNWKLILMALLLAALGLQTLRLSWSQTEVVTLQGEVVTEKEKVEKLTEDQATKKELIATLQNQMKENNDALDLWKRTNGKITTIVSGFHSQPAAQPIARKEVLDAQSSAAAVRSINDAADRMSW